MKSHILPVIKLTLLCLLLLAVFYPLAMFGIGKTMAPNGGEGELLEAQGRTMGYALIGQKFSDDRYFGRVHPQWTTMLLGRQAPTKGPAIRIILLRYRRGWIPFWFIIPESEPARSPAN